MDSYRLDEMPVLPQFRAGSADLGFEVRRLDNGRSAGVTLIQLVSGTKSVDVLPTRGMGIWQASNEGIRFGWNSPVSGPVHPIWVPVHAPDGLGWLEGFDEMMVRCGLTSNGAPEHDDRGRLIHPLHGRVANLPAHEVIIEIDDSAGRISVRGLVDEAKFHIRHLRLETELSLSIDADELEIRDRVVNLSDRSGQIQMLYHNNFGPPILEADARLHAPVTKLAARDEHAKMHLAAWDLFGPPQPGFAEQVYFMQLATDSDGRSTVLLTDVDKSAGVAVNHDTTTLPCFTLWKNTVGLADGYVTGLEPATNFPNPRSFELAHGRVPVLQPGESIEFSLSIGMLVNSSAIQNALDRISAISPANTEIHDSLESWR